MKSANGAGAATARGPDGQKPVAMVALGPYMGISGGDIHLYRLHQACNASGIGSRLFTPATMADRSPVPLDPGLVDVPTLLKRRSGLLAYGINVCVRMVRVAGRAGGPYRAVVAGSHYLYDTLPAQLIAARCRCPSYVFVYHVLPGMNRSSSARTVVAAAAEKLSLALIRRTRAVILYDNEDVASSLLERGFSSSQLVPTSNGASPPGELPPRIDPPSPTIVSCGRLTAEKGVWDVVHLAEKLAVTHPSARVLVVGDGPLRGAVESYKEAHGLDGLRLFGFVPEPKKWEILRSATLFVSASIEEGWGIAAGEAAYAGLPMVVYDLPAYTHLVGHVSRVAPGDRDAFAEAVLSVLADPGGGGPTDPGPVYGDWNAIILTDLVQMQLIEPCG